MGQKIYLDRGYYFFLCPGCQCVHGFYGTWQYNGNAERPTVQPSILVDKDKPEKRCHSYITDGKIHFLNDCFHDLKGQTIELPNWDE